MTAYSFLHAGNPNASAAQASPIYSGAPTTLYLATEFRLRPRDRAASASDHRICSSHAVKSRSVIAKQPSFRYREGVPRPFRNATPLLLVLRVVGSGERCNAHQQPEDCEKNGEQVNVAHFHSPLPWVGGAPSLLAHPLCSKLSMSSRGEEPKSANSAGETL